MGSQRSWCGASWLAATALLAALAPIAEAQSLPAPDLEAQFADPPAVEEGGLVGKNAFTAPRHYAAER